MATTNLGLPTIYDSDTISPDPINEGFTMIDSALGVDYVTTKGTSKVNFNSGFSVYVGTKVLTCDGTSVVLFTSTQFSTLTGHSYTNGRDVVVCNNGDNVATGVSVSASYNPSNKQVYVNLSSSVSGSIRFDYLVICMY